MEKIVSKELEQEIAEADKVRAFAGRRYFLNDMSDFGMIPSLVKSVIAAYNISDDKSKIEYMGDAYRLFHSMADEGGLAFCYRERLDNELIKLGFPDRHDGFRSYLNSKMDLELIKIRRANILLIREEGLSPEFLSLCASDLYMFGLVSSKEFDNLDDREKSKVIIHASKLRSLVGLSAVEKAKIRATWPRMQDEKIVENKEPGKDDILVQKRLDEVMSISDKIDLLAFDEERIKAIQNQREIKKANNELIEKEGLCPEFLEVCAFDLYMFGFISNAEYEMITAEEENEVINHALKLRGLVGLSARDKSYTRTTWPIKRYGQVVENYEPDALIALDNAFSISDKIESLAFKKYDKENPKTRARKINN